MHNEEHSRRIARNTLLLYLRMLLLMLIGLFTSRLVLQALGVEDFGTYNAVAGVVALCTILTNSISQAIGRYLAFELGRSDTDALRRIFAASMRIQLLFCLLVFCLTETLGLWFVRTQMDIPRPDAAFWVLQSAMGVLMLNLMSVPFTAVITAHEHMGAFARISVGEAILKLGVAMTLCYAPGDKLKIYALSLLGVALLVRLAYSIYARRHFEEVSRLSWQRGPQDRQLLAQMLGFSAWNFLGSGSFILNTQGVNLLTNVFFGVAMNAARGVALQVEGLVKQFAINVAYALNPQLTKSYAAGDFGYCFALVNRGAKYYFLILASLSLPLFLEVDMLLGLWLVAVPAYAQLFVRLTLLAVIADFTSNTLTQLALASGKIRGFYLSTTALSILVFPLTYLLFRLGWGAWCAYVVFALIYFLLIFVKLSVLVRLIDFPWRPYLRSLGRGVLALLPATAVTLLPWLLLPEGWLRLGLVLLLALLSLLASIWLIALDPDERDWLRAYVK